MINVQASVISVHSGALLAGRFRLQAELGSGAIGPVYHTFDPSRGQDVALRVLIGIPASDIVQARLGSHS